MRTNIKQHDMSDCGAACIASIAAYYGVSIPITVIREASGTGKSGTSIKGLLDAGAELGFEANGYRSGERNLDKLRILKEPVILHVLKGDNILHFVVLYGFRKDKAVIMDPAEGSKIKIAINKLQLEWSGYLVTMRPSDGLAVKNPGRKGTLLRFHSLLALSKKEYLLSLAGALAFVVTGLTTSLFLQHLIDNVIPGGDTGELIRIGSIMVVLMTTSIAIGYGRTIYTTRSALKIDSRIILTYLRHLFRLPVRFFSQRGAGELNSRIGDAMKIRSFLTDGVTAVMTSSLTLIVSFVLMFSYHWRLASLTLIFLPLYCLLYIVADRWNKKVNREIMESAALFQEKTVEGISAVRTIKHFGTEERYFHSIQKQYVNLAGKMYSGGKYAGISVAISEGITRLLSITILTAGSVFIFKGSMTTGEMVSFFTLSSYFAAPLGQLVELSNMISGSRIAAERIFDIIDLEPEGKETMTFPLEEAKDIIFHNVNFAYPGCGILLDNFNLVIEKGRITAIRGESGCGKSSLASLIMRDYRVNNGKILLDGTTDINLIDLKQWREYVSIVPQDVTLMNDTILANITCNDSEPDIEKVVEIIEELGLKEFVAGLPLGILTLIGERGSRLSGGQKQRIALARALYRDPSILILDEATSSLDKESEQFILDKLCNLRGSGKSIIMITHKDDNTRIADKTITLSAHS